MLTVLSISSKTTGPIVTKFHVKRPRTEGNLTITKGYFGIS